LAPARAASICAQICDALHAAHAQGILHRDLKPANVMLPEGPAGSDRVKILDFGLAKSLREEEALVTQAGVVMGTPGYLAPELLAGGPPSVASDLYTVGVILVELLTGLSPWGPLATRETQLVQDRGLPQNLPLPEAMRPLLDRL